MINTLITLFVMASLFSVALACFRPSLGTLLMISFVGLMLVTPSGLVPSVLLLILWLAFLVFIVIRLFPKVRKRFISKPVFSYISKVLPPMSDTEREAIESGTVGWEAEMFSGAPEWKHLFDAPPFQLSDEEQAFLDNQVDTYLNMSSPWHIHLEKDLRPEQWEYLKKEKFFALMISKEYGGLGFSEDAHAAIVTKVATHCVSSAVTVMVPNSLGPAKLLAHYGTDEQRNYYLPRLASGEEIPCFALTSPWAGSDAGAIPDTGIVTKKEIDGKEVLGFNINVSKRYITLAPIATLVGLAFKSYDPEGLLGGAEELGITCVLIPSTTEGLEIGNRHNPLDAHFHNGTIRATNVFIPLDTIIGGQANIGKGWRMLIESLSVGRGISLPGLANASGRKGSLVTGAYARVRRQFGMSVGKFEGVAEPLAEIAMNAYMMDAGCKLITSALRQEEKPAVLSAMLKYFNTEKARETLDNAMDIHAGKGIIMGPNNYLAKNHATIPIAITVEGANILTRSLMVFGQGAIRCHPFIQLEMAACANPDKEEGLAEFDELFVDHLGHITTNLARAFIFGISAGRLAPKTGYDLPKCLERKAQKAQQISASLAFVSDVSLGVLGGSLKRKEMLTGNLSDAWTAITMLTGCLKKWVDEGKHEADLLLVNATCDELLAMADNALDKALSNYPSPMLGTLMRWTTRPYGTKSRPASNKDKISLATMLLNENDAQRRLTKDVFISQDAQDPVTSLLDAHKHMPDFEQLHKKLKKAGYGDFTLPLEDMLEKVVSADILTEQEADRYLVIHEKIKRVIDVDEFKPEDY